MLFRRRTTVVTALSAVLLALSVLPAQAADTPEDPGQATSLKPGDAYVITEPELVADPQKVVDALSADGDLGRLDLKPTSGPSAQPKNQTKDAAGRSYTVPSERFNRGRKPADPYQYIDNVDECAANDSSSNDGGWIKNRFSYCQRHLIAIPAIQCGLWPPGCYIKGWFVSRNTIIGKAKIGGWFDSSYYRYADFDLDVDVWSSTGHFNKPGATMKAELECDGTWESGNGSAEDACDSGMYEGRTASPGAWKRDGKTKFDLVSFASSPPSAAAGPQIANADFRPKYEFTIPGYDQFQPTDGEEGKLRFDSAAYLRRGNMGAVFSDTTPALRYDRSDTSDPSAPGEPYLGVAAVANHIADARNDPDSTLPPKSDKNLPGAEATDPLHRLVPAAGATQRTRVRDNRNVVRAYCNGGDVPGGPADGVQCDEYPFASSYEGAARYMYDGSQYEYDYSVKYIDSQENEEAGRRLNAWYENDRIIDNDAFVIAIGD
ncbi:NucA/NucB deoxyribonuclease domain-containing protein [Streptomyces sp. BH097]|uniref:NucA/NucB deoxyribonuclease domain-containing protein n=1 Tax=Streptomyces sp. BH097 TaxID=3410406 RepID=UPI003CFB3AE2